MPDIVDELRDRSFSSKARDPLCERAADEIERLRERVLENDHLRHVSKTSRGTKPTPKEKRAEVSFTTHDAVPAAKAEPSASSVPLRNGAATGEPGGGKSTGNTQKRLDAVVAELHRQHKRHCGSGTCIEKVLKDASAALVQMRLTDEEREAVERGADALDGIEDLSAGAAGADAAAVFTLRSLLDRTETVGK